MVISFSNVLVDIKKITTVILSLILLMILSSISLCHYSQWVFLIAADVDGFFLTVVIFVQCYSSVFLLVATVVSKTLII